MNLAHVLSLLKGFVWKVGCGGALIRFDGMLAGFWPGWLWESDGDQHLKLSLPRQHK
jgi:hypothetical protein